VEEPRHGLGARPGDPADFAEQIVALLTDPQRRTAWGAAAAARARLFDAAPTAARVQACYARLLSC
jgi:hypothetical protein